MPEMLLEVERVSMRFGGLQALAELSFVQQAGSIQGLIGPNGAGKSTLFNVIAGVNPPTGGHVRFRGQAIERLPAYQRIRLGIARTFQNLQIFRDLTVLENVMVGCHSRFHGGMFAAMLRTPRMRAEEARMRDIAYDKLELLGMAHKAGIQAGALSFGEAKILEIARALAGEPTLLLLDEPVAGVPHGEVAQVADVIRRVNAQGTAILLVEHNMRFVMGLCAHIVVLNHGCKIAEGDTRTVRTHPDVLRAYLGAEETEHA
ncbi:ABC transporter ATP-binding protein [Verticiella sediminum]|uniref:ABC transporter ATP-binding protein n=1 Tax=Verticiella sediminum TaxID=1247510 RepID=A0A556B1Z8_9BURK|nr:ABC transporter ATP-binding protein [Verticiella sediminum]TSH99217.1 ABC transporter ATP-binding protein [Verticiella sediminum]